MLDLLTQIDRRTAYLNKYLPAKSRLNTQTNEWLAYCSRYQSDPHGYAKSVLKVSLTGDQSDILSSIRDNRYTLAQASHSVGKTFTAGIAANWWYDCWREHICYV